jgi:hypothetical protein
LNRLLLALIICGFLQHIPGQCQETFITRETGAVTEYTLQEKGRTFSPDPRKASMYSAVLPGLGQVYNRKYWKVPIVYGGFAALTWYTFFTHDEFVRFRTALEFMIDGNPETVHEFADDPRYTQDVITRIKDYYRRQRDFSVILTTLFYALNIVDAAVDAHMFAFDVSEDLGMKIGPSFRGIDQPAAGMPGAQFGLGLKIRLNF